MGRGAGQRGAHRLPRALSGAASRSSCDARSRPSAHAGARSRRRSCGSRPSSDARTSSPVFRGCCSATARRRAADRAAGERLRRLRRVGARGARQRARRAYVAVVRRTSARIVLRPAFVVAAAASSSSACGAAARVGAAEWTRAGEPIRVGLVQGNVDQDEKWDPARATAIFEQLSRDDAARRSARGAQLVLWPESSTPFYFEDDRAPAPIGARAGARGARPDSARQRSDRARRRPARHRPYYNSAFLVRPDGRPPASTGRCTSCRSASTCRSSGCSSSRRRWCEAVSDFSPGERAGRCCRCGGPPDQHGDLLRDRLSRIWCASSSPAAASC